jgi:hypothetical protein
LYNQPPIMSCPSAALIALSIEQNARFFQLASQAFDRASITGLGKNSLRGYWFSLSGGHAYPVDAVVFCVFGRSASCSVIGWGSPDCFSRFST